MNETIQEYKFEEFNKDTARKKFLLKFSRKYSKSFSAKNLKQKTRDRAMISKRCHKEVNNLIKVLVLLKYFDVSEADGNFFIIRKDLDKS